VHKSPVKTALSRCLLKARVQWLRPLNVHISSLHSKELKTQKSTFSKFHAHVQVMMWQNFSFLWLCNNTKNDEYFNNLRNIYKAKERKRNNFKYLLTWLTFDAKETLFFQKNFVIAILAWKNGRLWVVLSYTITSTNNHNCLAGCLLLVVLRGRNIMLMWHCWTIPLYASRVLTLLVLLLLMCQTVF